MRIRINICFVSVFIVFTRIWNNLKQVGVVAETGTKGRPPEDTF